MTKLHDIANNTKMHSDNVRAALRAIPTEIALELTQNQLEDLVTGIYKFGEKCFDDGYGMGEQNKDG